MLIVSHIMLFVTVLLVTVIVLAVDVIVSQIKKDKGCKSNLYFFEEIKFVYRIVDLKMINI